MQLVTGLPQALFTQKYAGIESLLAGEVSFKVNQEDVTLEITPETMPQAAGALFFQAKQDESILKEAVGVVDVGTYTTGFSVIEDGMFIDSRSGGCSVGVSQLAAALQENLLKEHGYSVDAAKIPQILMDKAIRHRGNPIDIADLISNQAMLVSRPMLEALRKSWNGGSDLLVYVAGGGAPYYLEAIKTVVPHAQPMADSFFAVVRGMHNYLLARR